MRGGVIHASSSFRWLVIRQMSRVPGRTWHAGGTPWTGDKYEPFKKKKRRFSVHKHGGRDECFNKLFSTRANRCSQHLLAAEPGTRPPPRNESLARTTMMIMMIMLMVMDDGEPTSQLCNSEFDGNAFTSNPTWCCQCYHYQWNSIQNFVTKFQKQYHND